MNESNETIAILPLILVTFPLAFGLLWFTVLNITSRLGGWHGLAQTYPDQGIPERYAEYMSSARMGWMNYNGILKLHADTRGLHLAVILPFRPGHSPLCVPWHAIKIHADSSWWIKLSRLEVHYQGRVIAKLLIRATTAKRLELPARVAG